MRLFIKGGFVAILAVLAAGPAPAGKADVVAARAERQGAAWTFHVTVRHDDTGWEHYADGWGVYAPDGTELGFRALLHPHVAEQPFTRSLSGVSVPADIARVILRARDSRHGWGGAERAIDLPGR